MAAIALQRATLMIIASFGMADAGIGVGLARGSKSETTRVGQGSGRLGVVVGGVGEARVGVASFEASAEGVEVRGWDIAQVVRR